MYTDKKFFVLFSQCVVFFFNLVIFIVSILLLNYYGVFSLGSDVVLTLPQKLFIILFSFSIFNFTFLIAPLIIDIISFCHSYFVKKRNLLINEISLQVSSNFPCYCCPVHDELKK